MAVARIFTRNPEAANSLQEELRRQGYTVEVVVPDQPAARSDNEFDLEFLRKAESPTYSDELITEFAPDAVALAAARVREKLTIVEVPDMVGAEMAVHPPVIAPVVMPSMPPVALASGINALAPAVNEVASEDLLRETPAQTEGSASQPGAEVFVMSPVHKFGVAVLERAQSWVNSCALFALRVIDVCRRQIHARALRMNENRQRRLLEQQARDAQAQQRAAEVQAAREAAAARLQQLLRERADMPPANLAALLGDDTSWSEDKATKALPDLSSATFSSATSAHAATQETSAPGLEMEPVIQTPVYQQEALLEDAKPDASRPVAFLSNFFASNFRGLKFRGLNFRGSIFREKPRKFHFAFNFNLMSQPERIWAGAVAAGALLVIGLAWMSSKPQPKMTAQLEQPAAIAPTQPVAVKPSPAQPQGAARVNPARRNGSASLLLAAMDKTTTRHLGDDVTIRVYGREMRRFTQTRPAAGVTAQPDFRRISDLQN